MNKLPRGNEIFLLIQAVESADFEALAKVRVAQDEFVGAFLQNLDHYLETESLMHDPETQHVVLLDFHKVCALLTGLNKAVLTRENFLYYRQPDGIVDAKGKSLSETAKKEYANGMCSKSLAMKDILENYEINLKTRLYSLSNSTR